MEINFSRKETVPKARFINSKKQFECFALKSKHLKCVFSFDTPNTHLCVSMLNPAYSFYQNIVNIKRQTEFIG